MRFVAQSKDEVDEADAGVGLIQAVTAAERRRIAKIGQTFVVVWGSGPVSMCQKIGSRFVPVLGR